MFTGLICSGLGFATGLGCVAEGRVRGVGVKALVMCFYGFGCGRKLGSVGGGVLQNGGSDGGRNGVGFLKGSWQRNQRVLGERRVVLV